MSIWIFAPLMIEFFIRMITDFRYGLSSLIIEPIIKPCILSLSIKKKSSLGVLKYLYDKLSPSSDYSWDYKSEVHRNTVRKLRDLKNSYRGSHESVRREFDYNYFETVMALYGIFKMSKFKIDEDIHYNVISLVKELTKELDVIKTEIKLDNSCNDVILEEVNYIRSMRELRSKIK